MKKLLCIIVITSCPCIILIAQSKEKENKSDSHGIHSSGKSNTISAGINIPFGKFSSTHNIGTAIDYAWSDHRNGSINEIPADAIGFTINAGINYYFGKKETIGIYSYEYSNYIYLYTYGGIIYNADKKINISLTAGPALGLYSGHTKFNIGANLKSSYYLKKNIAIAPVITVMKESKSDPLWAMAILAGFSF